MFVKPNGTPKQILCVRVDEASDEGPSHEEVWAKDHVKGRIATLVTT